MIISHSHKFIFVKTMKTAGTSIELALSKCCGPNDIVAPILPPEPELSNNKNINFKNAVIKRKDGKAIGRIRQHSPLAKIEMLKDPRLKSYAVITSERNPWTKLRSSFFWKLHQSPAQIKGWVEGADISGEHAQSLFESFVMNPVQDAPEAFSMYSKNNMSLATHVIRFEHLREDLETIRASLGLPADVALPEKPAKGNISPTGDKRPTLRYTEEMDKIVRLRFAREIALFGYNADGEDCLPYKAPPNQEAWR